MTIEELENLLLTYKITKTPAKVEETENMSMPFMLTTFRELIKDEVPPTQEEFIEYFKNKYPDLRPKGLISRLKRSYLSYIREYHLGYLLKKNFKKVIYNEKLDLLGVDYVIYYKRIKFNIHAFVNTENGRYWREIKNGRHKFYGHHIDMPLDLKYGKRVGRIILYNDNHIDALKKQMESVIKSKNKAVQEGNFSG